MALSVDEIREKLVELGLSETEANSIKGKTNLLSKLNELSPTEDEDKPFEIEQEDVSVLLDTEPVIYPSDPEWKDKIMKAFDPKDEIFNGCPTVDGLRRVTEKYLGPILESNAKVIQAPNKDNDYHAVVEHEIVILRTNYLEGDQQPYKQIVTEVADVRTDENDNKFTKYSAGYASTRAEGRALRKLLRLRKVVAAEEIDENSGFDDHNNDNLKITHNLCMTINILAKRINANAWDLIKSGSPIKLNRPSEIPFNLAKEIIKYMNSVQRGEEELPKDFIGYKPITLD